MLELVLKYVVAPAITILAPLLGAALLKLIAYLHSKEKESKAALVGAMLAETAKVVIDEAVRELEPLVRKDLEDGKLTHEELAELKAKALEILKAKAPPALLAGAKNLFGPLVDSWLEGLVARASASALPPQKA